MNKSDHLVEAKSHVSNAMDDLDREQIAHALPQLREAMHHIRMAEANDLSETLLKTFTIAAMGEMQHTHTVIDAMIAACPTGAKRNKISEAGIHLLSAFEALKAANKIDVSEPAQ